MYIGLFCVMGFFILALLVRLVLLQNSIQEVADELNDKLNTDTNTLITISSGNRKICLLAEQINQQLLELRAEKLNLLNGNLELKTEITNISHDLRTPLTAICGYLDLLEQEEVVDNVAKYLNVIRERTNMMRSLTEELFQYSLMALQEEELHIEQVCINDILEQSLVGFYGLFTKKDIIPDIQMPEIKIMRYLDKMAVRRVFDNILSNAARYADGDFSVKLTAEGKILFSNHAANLSRVEVERLFERFFTVQTAKESTGIGLSIAKVLTEKMAGNIDAAYSAGYLRIQVIFPENKERKRNKMKKRAFLLIAVLAMTGILCACERQSTGVMKTTGGKEQTVSEKEKVIDNNVEQIVGNANENIEPESVRSNKESTEMELTNILDEINTDIQPGTAGTYMNAVRVASHLLNWGVGTSMGTEEIKSQVLSWLSEKGNDEQVAFSRKLSSVYDAYQELLGSDAEELLASAGGDMSGYPWSDSPVETIEAIIDVVQLPENEENIVEDQPTEEVDEDTVDNESQEDFSEEIEEENPESSLENEDYPGEDVVEIINLQGETTTVYKLVDGRYMDRTNTVYIYDGKDTWTDMNGVEWNQEVK